MTGKSVHCPECGCDISADYMSADAARRRFFAILRDVHANLRDEHRERWPNAEILRKHALIAVGHCDALTIACGSNTAAPNVANAFRLKDQYCVASIRGSVVTVFSARSMARRALPKKDFMRVADQVFAWLHAQTGINPTQSHEGRAAA